MGVVVPFNTIPEMFFNLTDRFAKATKPVMMHKVEGKYQEITYAELRRKVELFASGLASLGLKQGERVAIISENRPEWVVSDISIVSLAAVDVPVYPTMTAKQTEFIFNDAGVRFAIVSNQFQLNKVLKIMPDVKTLKKVILMADKTATVDQNLLLFADVMKMGEEYLKRHPNHITEARKKIKADDLLTFIYTSGTTGNPKGVMLTHHNLVSNIQSTSTVIPFGPDEVMLSFLPLSHSFERMGGYYTALACGVTIAYAESVDTVANNLAEVKPTIVTTVPRLFERIHSRILKAVEGGPPSKKKIFYWSVAVGREYALARKQKRVSISLRAKYQLADQLVFKKLRDRVGGRLKFFVSGGAALPREFAEFFEAVGILILEGYGLTETSPVITVNRLDNYKFGAVGLPIPGAEVKIAEDGEILARGPNIMKGYWNNRTATKEVIDKDGWFHTGDIGMIDSDGFVYITDRKKHLFVSSGGKNIAPQPIENLFLSSQYIEQFVLIGDRRMFLSAIIVPDFDAVKSYAKANNLPYEKPSELVKAKEVIDLIEKDIGLLQKDLANFERVRKFALLERPLSIEDGELTPTMKVKRKVVEERYQNLIEGMYEGLK